MLNMNRSSYPEESGDIKPRSLDTRTDQSAAEKDTARRGGRVRLNSLAGFCKWISASVMPQPGLAATR